MSIVDEIERLFDVKADIKSAIEAKGVTVPSSAHIDVYPSYISSIPTATPPVIQSLNVSANGTYSAPVGVDGYSPVSVAVPASAVDTGTKNITTNGTHDVIGYANASVSVLPVLQSKSATPSLTVQNITPDGGYDGLSSVSVDAVTGALLSSLDPDFVAGNIKENVDLFGVVGTFAGGGGGVNVFDEYLSGIYTHPISASVTSLGPSAFMGALGSGTLFNGVSVSFPNVSTIGNYAFSGCTGLVGASFPSLRAIGGSAFYGCGKLSEFYAPNVATLSTSAFMYCSALKSVMFNDLSVIGSEGFRACWALSEVSLPNVSSICSYAFSQCSSLAVVSFPKAQIINTGAFQGAGVTTAYFGKDATSNASGYFYNNVFRSCYSLKSVYLLHSKVYIMNHYNVFQSTPMSLSSYLGEFGSIYVRASMYSAYITATYWSNYAARFVSLTDEQIAAL